MTDTVDVATIQADFDRLALLSSEKWDHNNHYHRFLLRQVPQRCRNVLEIGCGTGMFARLLARRAEHVLALDLSPQMISLARERSGQYANIDFQVADVLAWEFSPEQFDCIVSIATLHHLPMEEWLSGSPCCNSAACSMTLSSRFSCLVLFFVVSRRSHFFTCFQRRNCQFCCQFGRG